MKGSVEGGKMERADEAKEMVPLSLQKLRDLAESLKASMPVCLLHLSVGRPVRQAVTSRSLALRM